MVDNNTYTSEPKPEDIERLMANPNEYQLFDKVYGDGASLKYLSADQVKPKEEDKEPEKEEQGIISNIGTGIKEAGRETLETIQGISNALKDAFPNATLQ